MTEMINMTRSTIQPKISSCGSLNGACKLRRPIDLFIGNLTIQLNLAEIMIISRVRNKKESLRNISLSISIFMFGLLNSSLFIFHAVLECSFHDFKIYMFYS